MSNPYIDGLISFLELQSTKNNAAKIIDIVQKTLNSEKGQKNRDVYESTLLSLKIIKQIEFYGLIDVIEKPLNLGLDFEEWVTICGLLVEEDERGKYWAHLTPFSEKHTNQLDKVLQSAITDSSLDEIHRDCIRVSTEIFHNIKWVGVCTKIAEQLDITKSNEIASVGNLVETLLLLQQLVPGKVTEVIEKLAESGSLAYWYHYCRDDSEIAVTIIVLHIIGTPDLDIEPKEPDSIAGLQLIKQSLKEKNQELIAQIVNKLNQFKQLHLLFEIADAQASYEPFVKAALNHIFESPKLRASFFTPNVILKRWHELQNELDEADFISVLQESIDREELLENIYGTGKKYERENAGLYRWIIEDLAKPPVDFEGWCQEQIPLFDKESWIKELSNVGNTLRAYPRTPVVLRVDQANERWSIAR